MNLDVWRGLPSWVKAILTVGAPTAAAAWFIFLFSNMLTGDLRELKAAVQAHTTATDVAISRSMDSRAAQELKLDVLIQIMQTQCVNAATDALQRRDCINAGGGRR